MTMNDKNERKEKKLVENFYEKVGSYGMTKKTLYSAISILAMIAIVFVLSFTQAGFDVSKLQTVAYWVNFVILAGLSIYGMVSGTQIGDDTARNNPKGAFRAVLSKYKTIYDDIDTKGYFAFFGDWLGFYKARKLEKAKKDFLSDNGIRQFEVLDLDVNELDLLSKPFKKDWKGTMYEGKYKEDTTYFVSYTAEQILAIKICLEGKIKVANIDETFFKSVYSQDGKDMWESASRADLKKNLFLFSSYSFKIILMLASSMLLTGLVGGWKDGIIWSEALLQLFTRLGNMLMSIVLGVYIGFSVVKIDLTYLEFKTNILKLYKDELGNGVFVPMSIDEKAKLEYEKNLKKNEVEANDEQ